DPARRHGTPEAIRQYWANFWEDRELARLKAFIQEGATSRMPLPKQTADRKSRAARFAERTDQRSAQAEQAFQLQQQQQPSASSRSSSASAAATSSRSASPDSAFDPQAQL